MDNLINQKQQPVKITIKPSDTTAVTCPCGGEVFADGMLIRRVSAFLTGSPKPTLSPIPVPYCVKCGKACIDFLPEDLKPVIEV